MQKTRLTAGLVIATYQRLESLKKSLHYWQNSRRPIDQIIIVDASLDAAKNRQSIFSLFPKLFEKDRSIYLTTTVPSSTAQRNLGLDKLWTDIALFPDDDQFPSEDYLEKLIEVFELDAEERIAGVRGRMPFLEQNDLTKKIYDFIDRRSDDFCGWFISKKDLYPKGIKIPHSVKHLPVKRVPVIWQAGTNFRTKLIKEARFDENMKRYALNEDFEVSLRLGKKYCLVERTDAYIDHFPSPHGRVNRLQVFHLHWLNCAYLIRKNVDNERNKKALRKTLSRTALMHALKEKFPFLPTGMYFSRYSFPLAEKIVDCILNAPKNTFFEVYSNLQNYILDERNYLKDINSFLEWKKNRYEY